MVSVSILTGVPIAMPRATVDAHLVPRQMLYGASVTSLMKPIAIACPVAPSVAIVISFAVPSASPAYEALSMVLPHPTTVWPMLVAPGIDVKIAFWEPTIVEAATPVIPLKGP